MDVDFILGPYASLGFVTDAVVRLAPMTRHRKTLLEAVDALADARRKAG